MADKELSTITDASTPLDGTEKYYIVQSGNTREAAGLDILKPTLSAADQTSVRSAFSAALKGHVYGLTLSNNGTDANNDIDIAAGEAASTETYPVLMVLSSAITKRLDASWAVGTGNGGLDTGSKANSTWYYVWLIRRSDTGVVDVLFSTSATSPTMPTNYDQKRRLPGAIKTDGSGNIIAFIMSGRRVTWKAIPGTAEY
ncbi:MAG: hypothetical protein KDJ43_06465, partial [Rhizobiaceae bacterium]|nr:hypothetical protein [Rhizobiaceae bacterium]